MATGVDVAHDSDKPLLRLVEQEAAGATDHDKQTSRLIPSPTSVSEPDPGDAPSATERIAPDPPRDDLTPEDPRDDFRDDCADEPDDDPIDIITLEEAPSDPTGGLAGATRPYSAELTGDIFPRLLPDLETRVTGHGPIEVRAPGKPTWFPIYDVEWRAAQMLDGRRNVTELMRKFATLGLAGTPEAVRAFIVELAAYGFLAGDSIRAVEGGTGGGHREARKSDESAEVRQLIDQALALHRRGRPQEGMGYLLAALEIDPGHHEARQLLERSQHTISIDGNDRPPTDAAPAGEPPPPVSSASPSQTRVSRAALIIAAVALCQLPFTVWIATKIGGSSDAGPAPQQSQTPTATPQQVAVHGTANQTGAAGGTTSFMATLTPGEFTAVTAGTKGMIAEIAFEAGQSVARGDVVARIASGRIYKRFARLKKAEAALSRRNSTMARYDLAGVRAALAKLVKKSPLTPVTAPQAGTVMKILAAVGAPIKANGVVLEIGDSASLRAQLPASAAAGPGAHSCAVRNPSAPEEPAPCAIEPTSTGAKTVVVRIDNSAGQFAAGDWAQIVVGPAQK